MSDTSIFGTTKLVAAVRVEGTLRGPGDDDEVNKGALDNLRRIRDSGDYYIVLCSSLAHTERGLKKLNAWVVENDVPYDEVWASPGTPPCDEWYDNAAVSL